MKNEPVDNSQFAASPFSLADLASFLWQKKWAILFSISLIVSLGGYYFLQLPKIYSATATLLLEEESRNFSLRGNGTSISAAAEDKMDTHIEFIRSWQFSRGIVEEFALYDRAMFKTQSPYTTKEEKVLHAVGVLQRNLKLRKVAATKMLKVSFESPEPELAKTIANAIGPAFFEFQDVKKQKQAEQASSWLTTQLDNIGEQLELAQNALQQFLEEKKIVDIDSQMALLRNEITNVKQEKIYSDKELIELASYNQQAQTAKENYSAVAKVGWIARHASLIEMRQKLLQEQQAFSQITKRYKEKHHKYIAAASKLEQIEEKFIALVDELRIGLEKAYWVVKARNEDLAQQVEFAESRHQALGIHELELDRLRREVETAQKIYDVFLSRLQETEILRDLGNSNNFEIVDYATLPSNPAKPRLVLLFAVLIVLASIVSIGFWLLLHLISDKKTRYTDLLRKNHISVLGVIPKKSNIAKRRWLISRRRQDRAALLYAEAIRKIRGSLILRTENKAGSSIAITAIKQTPETLAVTAQLAESFSRLNKTILVDADFREPDLHNVFEIDEHEAGLGNFILKEVKFNQAVKKLNNGQLSVLPSGILKYDPLVYISKYRFKLILERIGLAYDRVLVQTPQISQYNDTLVTAKNTDGLVIICDPDNIESSDLVDHIQQVLESGITLMGVVFCGAKHKH